MIALFILMILRLFKNSRIINVFFYIETGTCCKYVLKAVSTKPVHMCVDYDIIQ